MTSVLSHRHGMSKTRGTIELHLLLPPGAPRLMGHVLFLCRPGTACQENIKDERYDKDSALFALQGIYF